MKVAAGNNKAFTLVEVLVVVAIIGILAGIGWPLYEGTQMRSRRSDAIMGILAAQQFMEECYNNTRDYTASPDCDLPAANTTSPKGYYVITLVAAQRTRDGYELQATPVAGSLQANDTDCAVISIKSTGDKSGSTNSFCWAQ